MRSQRVAGCIVLFDLMVVAVPAAPVSATRCLYTAHVQHDVVSVTDLTRGVVVGTIPFKLPYRTEARPGSLDVYVATLVPHPLIPGQLINGLARLDPLQARVTQTIPFASGAPFDVAFTADGSLGAVTFGREADRLSLFTPADGGVKRILTDRSAGAGTDLFDVALSADGTTAWATAPYDNRVLKVDLASAAITASIPLAPEFRARRIVLSPDGTTAYVTGPPTVLHIPGSITEGPGRLLLIDTATATVRETIPLPHAPEDIELSPDGAVVWVTYPNGQALGAIDTADGGVTTVTFDGSPIDLIFAPDGDELYATDSTLTSDAIAVIDTASAAIAARIPIPQQPGGLSIVELDGDCAAAPTVCPGDCDADGAVDVSELLAGVAISFDRYRLRRCLAADSSWDGQVDVADLTRAIGRALGGCPPAP